MRNLSTPLILAFAVIVTRIPFTSRYLFNIDSVQFALATWKFDVALHQPHPPGYVLYVMMGKFFLIFTKDENNAFIAVSILFSALAVVAVYYLAKEIFDRESAFAAAVIAISSPVFWLHGEVALSYAPEAFMSVLFAFLCFRMQKGEGGLYWAAAVALAVSGGIRQNTMVFLFPLWLYSMRGLGVRRMLASIAIFGIALASWFVPMLHMSGGYASYIEALKAHWQNAASHDINLKWISSAVVTCQSFDLGLGASVALPLAAAYFRIRKLQIRNWNYNVFVVLVASCNPFHLIIFMPSIVPATA
jgi:4-amino-4-deoxy-L-arabinose transferase-like glycosyltransferase